jgi:hypothetical protein
VQELAGLQPEQLGSRPDVDQLRTRPEHALDGQGVGLGTAGVEGDVREVCFGAGGRRTPVDAGDVDVLVEEGLGEDVDARGRDAGGLAEESGDGHGCRLLISLARAALMVAVAMAVRA